MKQAHLFSIGSRVALLGAFVAVLILFGHLSFTHAAVSTDQTRVHTTKGVSSSCGTWNVAFSPNPSTTVNVFNGVAATATNDAWAAGYYKDNSTFAELTLIEHWNGSRWSIVPSPNVGTNSFLYGIAASSASNAWAVGAYEDSKGASHALTEQWNGSSWNVVSNPASYLSELFGVTVISANDVWAVGDQKAVPVQTLIEHWNGTSLSIVSSPSPGSVQNSLRAVASVKGTNQVWTVGYSQSGVAHSPQTLIERWNGTQWNVVASQNPGSGYNQLWGVTTVSASDIWAVGNTNNTNAPTQTLIEQWNGSTWSVVPSPNVSGSVNDFLFATATLSTDNVWAVGVDVNSNGLLQTLTEQWNGSHWSVVPSANKGAHYNMLSGVATISKTGGVWAVGKYTLKNTSNAPSRSLTEFYC